MKYISSLLLGLLTCCPMSALQAQDTIYQGKQIYIPRDLRAMDLHSDTAQWSFKRMAATENIALFWAPGFGQNLGTAPSLDGHNMRVDLANLLEKLEADYHYFADSLQFIKSDSKAHRYKMMVMLDYSLEGTAYGGDYDEQIGALWIAPNRVQDSALCCIAHELGHSFQLQIIADKAGEAWGGSGFFEMTSQWMLWHMNPWWLRDENYHFEAFKRLTHKAFLHLENIYHSPYVLEWWSEKHGLPFIAEMYRQGRVGEDPVATYQRMTGLSQQAFNAEMLDCYLHLMDFDLTHARTETRPYTLSWGAHVEPAKHAGWFQPVKEETLEDYGFNAIRLAVPAPGKKVSLSVRPLQQGRALRYALVGVTEDGRSIYGRPASKGEAQWQMPKNTKVKALYAVVMGAPAEHLMLDNEHPEKNRTYPYEFKVNGTSVKKQ